MLVDARQMVIILEKSLASGLLYISFNFMSCPVMSFSLPPGVWVGILNVPVRSRLSTSTFRNSGPSCSKLC